MENFLEVIDLTKAFPGVLANDHVNLTVRSGEVHAILGENGAGKSTLMKLIYGLYQPDSGEIKLAGQTVSFRSPSDAIHSGIGMVHQHFMLIPALTVAENIVLGEEPGGIHYDRKAANEQVRKLSEQYRLTVDPAAKVKDLSVGLQQRVEILKALYRQAKLLILDEPTALLTPQETRELFEVVNHLKAQGIPILFISHKLDEVKEISDRVTVMRAGRTVDTISTEGCNTADTGEHDGRSRSHPAHRQETCHPRPGSIAAERCARGRSRKARTRSRHHTGSFRW